MLDSPYILGSHTSSLNNAVRRTASFHVGAYTAGALYIIYDPMYICIDIYPHIPPYTPIYTVYTVHIVYTVCTVYTLYTVYTEYNKCIVCTVYVVQ